MSATDSAITKAIAKGLQYLTTVQQPDGSFISYSSPKQRPFQQKQAYHTTFAPAIILAALGPIDSPAAKKVRTPLARWLLDQKSAFWSYNYWAKEAPQRRSQPYPDDLDDTFCVLSALYLHDTALIDAEILAHATKLLIATESRIGGPYRTWLVANDSPEVWLDQDIAVNSNIAHFLKLVAEPLPNLTAVMEQAITAHDLASRYYPSVYTTIYYLARAYTGPKRAMLYRQLMLLASNGLWDTPLHTALAVSAALQLRPKARLHAAVANLLAGQRANGSWPAEAFCLDPAQQGITYYNGAPAVTTACALEALSRYAANHQARAPVPQAQQVDTQAAGLQARIIDTATLQLDSLDQTLGHNSQAMLQRILASEHSSEITLLPYLFARSLREGAAVPDVLFITLGLANLYGWMAYTIYDDFLDEEGQPDLLPTANVAMRYSLANFAKVAPKNGAFQRLVRQTFDGIDAANAWEVTHCRFAVQAGKLMVGKLPRYGQLTRLAERSQGHALTPLGILATMGTQPKAVTAIHQALRHYLIARQLNDDLHDWEHDVQTGQITYVVKTVLQELRIPPGSHDLASLLLRMQRQFWHHSITTVWKVMARHTALGRQAAAHSNLLTSPNVFTTLFDKLDNSLARGRKEQAEAEQFLQAFQDK